MAAAAGLAVAAGAGDAPTACRPQQEPHSESVRRRSPTMPGHCGLPIARGRKRERSKNPSPNRWRRPSRSGRRRHSAPRRSPTRHRERPRGPPSDRRTLRSLWARAWTQGSRLSLSESFRQACGPPPVWQRAVALLGVPDNTCAVCCCGQVLERFGRGRSATLSDLRYRGVAVGVLSDFREPL
jgi:hypothetical protein